MSKESTMAEKKIRKEHIEDIDAMMDSLNGGDAFPGNGAAWLGNGELPVLTDDGHVGWIVHSEDDGWWFRPARTR